MDNGSYQTTLIFRLFWVYFSKTDIKVIFKYAGNYIL